MKNLELDRLSLKQLDQNEIVLIDGGDADGLMRGTSSDTLLKNQSRLVGFVVGFFSALFE